MPTAAGFGRFIARVAGDPLDSTTVPNVVNAVGHALHAKSRAMQPATLCTWFLSTQKSGKNGPSSKKYLVLVGPVLCGLNSKRGQAAILFRRINCPKKTTSWAATKRPPFYGGHLL